jgi:hypothetical protein
MFEEEKGMTVLPNRSLISVDSNTKKRNKKKVAAAYM